ncbi:hypothetical protein FSP39_018911 [Pinctada imbricata]|uniref:Uncharacterized protein n=1 Tax=Pinctada imbricata TaxID=66713 RepID=A0AA88YEN8_PINIB|nr:hypothetical protein FSP39_018911 [Pinctada imbricata]
MQAGDAYSSWAPGLTPLSGVRFFSHGGESRIGTIPLAEVNATNEPVYLLGQTYPSPISNTTATCSVQTDDCYAIITMYIVDLRLYNGSVGCTQTLDVSGITLTCADNNNFEIRPVTRSSYMRIKFDSSVTNQGFFWVGFQCMYILHVFNGLITVVYKYPYTIIMMTLKRY